MRRCEAVLEDLCLFSWAPLERSSQSLCPVETFALFIHHGGKRVSETPCLKTEEDEQYENNNLQYSAALYSFVTVRLVTTCSRTNGGML